VLPSCVLLCAQTGRKDALARLEDELGLQVCLAYAMCVLWQIGGVYCTCAQCMLYMQLQQELSCCFGKGCTQLVHSQSTMGKHKLKLWSPVLSGYPSWGLCCLQRHSRGRGRYLDHILSCPRNAHHPITL
jgi:hypothetical protein